MKIVRYLAAIIVIIILFTACSRKGGDNNRDIGIVKASKLALRELPSLESKIIRYYDFGTPVEIDAVSENKDKISGIEEHWYRDKKNGGWLFGGFLIRTDYNIEKTGHFRSEMIRCNVICGGNSCFFQFSPYIINEYYVASVYMYDYPENGEPEEGIIIGRCKVDGNKIIFYNAEEIIALYGDGKSDRDILNEDFDTKYFFKKDFRAVYKKHKDEEGDFFTHENSDPLESRLQLREKCKDAKMTDEIWVEVNTFINLTVEEIQKRFPLKLYSDNK